MRPNLVISKKTNWEHLVRLCCCTPADTQEPRVPHATAIACPPYPPFPPAYPHMAHVPHDPIYWTTTAHGAVVFFCGGVRYRVFWVPLGEDCVQCLGSLAHPVHPPPPYMAMHHKGWGCRTVRALDCGCLARSGLDSHRPYISFVLSGRRREARFLGGWFRPMVPHT